MWKEGEPGNEAITGYFNPGTYTISDGMLYPSMGYPTFGYFIRVTVFKLRCCVDV